MRKADSFKADTGCADFKRPPDTTPIVDLRKPDLALPLDQQAVKPEAALTSCATLPSLYAAALIDAMICPSSSGTIACTQQVFDSVGCNCTTYAHADNQGPIQKLTYYRSVWASLGCKVGCVAFCPAAAPTTCVAGSCP